MAILCINMSIWLVNAYNLMPQYSMIPGTTPAIITGSININGTITPSPDINLLNPYDIWGTMSKVWNLIGTSVLGIPLLLYQLGAPVPIQVVLDALYMVILIMFFLEFTSGRDIID